MSEGHMTISVEQVKKLIDDYWGYERECRESSGEIAYTRAALYRTVIMDLEKLLPRKSMADVAPGDWWGYEGSWVECRGHKCIMTGSQYALGVDVLNLFYPAELRMMVADPDEIFPLDGIDRAWDSEGNPI